MFHNAALYPNEGEVIKTEELLTAAKFFLKDMEDDCKFLSEQSDRPPAFWRKGMEGKDFILDAEKALECGIADKIGVPR